MNRQDVKDEVIHLRSAGVDLGKRFLLACVRAQASRNRKWGCTPELPGGDPSSTSGFQDRLSASILPSTFRSGAANQGLSSVSRLASA